MFVPFEVIKNCHNNEYCICFVAGFHAMSVVEQSLVFYNYPLAFNPAKVRLALEEKGLKVICLSCAFHNCCILFIIDTKVSYWILCELFLSSLMFPLNANNCHVETFLLRK